MSRMLHFLNVSTSHARDPQDTQNVRVCHHSSSIASLTSCRRRALMWYDWVRACLFTRPCGHCRLADTNLPSGPNSSRGFHPPLKITVRRVRRHEHRIATEHLHAHHKPRLLRNEPSHRVSCHLWSRVQLHLDAVSAFGSCCGEHQILANLSSPITWTAASCHEMQQRAPVCATTALHLPPPKDGASGLWRTSHQGTWLFTRITCWLNSLLLLLALSAVSGIQSSGPKELRCQGDCLRSHHRRLRRQPGQLVGMENVALSTQCRYQFCQLVSQHTLVPKHPHAPRGIGEFAVASVSCEQTGMPFVSRRLRMRSTAVACHTTPGANIDRGETRQKFAPHQDHGMYHGQPAPPRHVQTKHNEVPRNLAGLGIPSRNVCEKVAMCDHPPLQASEGWPKRCLPC